MELLESHCLALKLGLLLASGYWFPLRPSILKILTTAVLGTARNQGLWGQLRRGTREERGSRGVGANPEVFLFGKAGL